MRPFINRQPARGIPAFKDNAALQLVVACGAAFIIVEFSRVCLIVYNQRALADVIYHAVGLPGPYAFKDRWWTVLTYGFLSSSFWNYLSNMIWLYTFANLVQNLVGYRQVIPLFIYALILGGFAGLGAEQLSWQGFGAAAGPILTPAAGISAMAAAALTISPRHRFYLGESLGIPLWVVVVVFFVLNVLGYPGAHGAMLGVAVGGGFAGLLYMRMLQNGFRPGHWMYALRERADRWATPDERKTRPTARRSEVLRYEARGGSVSQRRVDDILDKINVKGFSSLTKEEKEILMQAGKDGNHAKQ